MKRMKSLIPVLGVFIFEQLTALQLHSTEVIDLYITGYERIKTSAVTGDFWTDLDFHPLDIQRNEERFYLESQTTEVRWTAGTSFKLRIHAPSDQEFYYQPGLLFPNPPHELLFSRLLIPKLMVNLFSTAAPNLVGLEEPLGFSNYNYTLKNSQNETIYASLITNLMGGIYSSSDVSAGTYQVSHLYLPQTPFGFSVFELSGVTDFDFVSSLTFSSPFGVTYDSGFVISPSSFISVSYLINPQGEKASFGLVFIPEPLAFSSWLGCGAIAYAICRRRFRRDETVYKME